MKKIVRPVIVIVLLLTAFVLYKYILFDHEPFEKIKVTDIDKIYLARLNDDRRIEINNIPQFLEYFEDVELHCRTNELRQENVITGVKVSIYYKDGTISIISVDNFHVQTDRVYEAERESAIEFIRYANQLIFNNTQLENHYDKTRYDKVIDLYLQGMQNQQVRTWCKERLLEGIIDDVMLKTLANSGWAPEQMYAVTDEKRNEIIYGIKESVMPGGAVRRLTYEAMADEVLQKYKNGEITYDNIFEKEPDDFLFPEFIDWSKYSVGQGETGYFGVSFPSLDDKYVMMIIIDDMMFDAVIREEPLIKRVGFYKK